MRVYFGALCMGPPFGEDGFQTVLKLGPYGSRGRGAVVLAAQGIPLPAIHLLSRWSSKAVERYTHTAPLARLEVALRLEVHDMSAFYCLSDAPPEAKWCPCCRAHAGDDQERSHSRGVLMQGRMKKTSRGPKARAAKEDRQSACGFDWPPPGG